VVLDRGWPADEARAFGFAILLLSQPLLLAVERSPHVPLWRHGGLRLTRQVIGAAAVIVVLTVSAVYVGPLADLLSLAPFPIAGWMAVITIAAVTTLWSEAFKRPGARPAVRTPHLPR